MRLRTILLSVFLLAAFAALACAQQPAGPRPDAAGMIGPKMAQELGLTKEQVQQIHQIVLKYHQDVAAELKSSDSRDQKKDKVKQLHDAAAAAIMGLLNDDQKAKAEKMHLVQILLEPRARLDAQFAAMLAKLNLTDDQKASIKKIEQDTMAAVKAVQGDKSLDEAAKTAKITEIRKAGREKILAVLTPEQKAQLKQMMENARDRGGARRPAK